MPPGYVMCDSGESKGVYVTGKAFKRGLINQWLTNKA